MSKEQVKFEIRTIFDEKNQMGRGIFIDGEHFDWGVDEENFKDAVERSKKMGGKVGSAYIRSIQDSIQKHFLESLSEFVGRKVTGEEVNEAQKTGWIAK